MIKRFKSILFSPLGEQDNPAALRRVIDLAKMNQATITLLGIGPEAPKAHRILGRKTLVENFTLASQNQLQQRLERIAHQSKAPTADIAVELGNPALEIIQRVITDGHDLVVVTTDEDNEDTSTINRLLRKCPCPVWVVRPTRARKHRVLAAVNADPDELDLNRTLTDIAASTVDLYGGELHVVHVWELFAEDMMRSPMHGGYSDSEIAAERSAERSRAFGELSELLAPSRVRGAKWKVHLVNGAPAEVIPDLVTRHRINLLVMGTVARTGIRGLVIGNTAEKVLNEVRCSVLTVKPSGFVSPLAQSRPS